MVYGKCEMMAEYICYGVLYIAEATIAWLYFDALFCRKSSGLRIGITCAVAYLLLFGITWFNSVVLNGAAFFLANLLLLWMNYECKLRSAILHSAFLTSIMAITEIIAAWIISLFGFRFGAYADSLAIMIVMAVISKMLYFSITVIAAKLWAPNRQAQEEPAFMGLLCILPIFSVIVSAVVVYIGVRAEMTKPVELLMIIIVLTLLIVNLIFMVIYNHLQRMHAEQLAMNLSIQKEEADAAYYQDLQKQSENQRMLLADGEHFQLLAAFEHGRKPLVAFCLVLISVFPDSVEHSGNVLCRRAGQLQGNFRTLQADPHDLLRCVTGIVHTLSSPLYLGNSLANFV